MNRPPHMSAPSPEAIERVRQIAERQLSAEEFDDLVAFVRDGLTDPRSLPAGLCAQVPAAVPSGMPVVTFEGCP